MDNKEQMTLVKMQSDLLWRCVAHWERLKAALPETAAVATRRTGAAAVRLAVLYALHDLDDRRKADLEAADKPRARR